MVQERKCGEKSASRSGPEVPAKAEQLFSGTTEIITNERDVKCR